MEESLKTFLTQHMEVMPEGALNFLTWRTDARMSYRWYCDWCLVRQHRAEAEIDFAKAILELAPRSRLKRWENGDFEFVEIRIHKPSYK